jgi:colanic acid biosynthesis glycosyl transferase WcaI
MLLQVLWRPDVVWGVEPALMCAPSVLLTARLSGAGAWLHVQDFEVDAAFDLGLVRAPWLKSWVLGFERFLMNRFDKVSTISANMLALLLDKGVPLPRTELFPNWVDTAVIKPLTKDPSANLGFVGRGYRAEWGVSDEAVIALYSGNMGEKQGLEMVVEAARRLTAHNDICFVMCGEGAAYGRLRQMAEGLTNILWMPLQPFERLNELLNAADIHLLPQRASAADLVMPSKLTGIFASGRPVVAAAEPDTAVYEAVKGRGLVVQPDDVDRFFAAILDLAGNTTERQKLGQAARDYAIKNLDKDVILVRFEKALMHL